MKVSSFQGPLGDRSVNVIPTKITPVAANKRHSDFSPINSLWGATLEKNEGVSSAMTAVEDAIIVAGGLGARMLPASSAIAKESMPLVDIPALTHLVREAVNAGVKRVHIITSPKKDLSGFFRDNTHLSIHRNDIPEELISPFADVEYQVHIQHVPKGFGDALSCALHAISGPFLVLLGDNLLIEEHTPPSNYVASNACNLLVDAYVERGLPCVGLSTVQDPENYGVVVMSDNKIIEIVEKPPRESAPSNKVLCGRYLFTEDTLSLLEKYAYEEFGEMQSIAVQQHWIRNDGLIGVDLSNYQWYDSGSPLPWIKSQIDHALRREDFSDDLRKWLESRL